MSPATVDLLLRIAYVGPVGLALAAGAVVLYLNRRKAPRACRVGALALGGLLLFNAALLGMNEILLYNVQNGEVVSLVVWRYQVLMLVSAAVHALAIGLVTAAVLMDRRPAPAEPPD